MSPSLFLVVFSLYILMMIALSIYISRRQDSGEDFLLGNREVPFLLMLGTTVATMVGTGSSMGAIGKGYSAGWAGSLYGIGGGLGILLLALLFANARKHRFMTFAEEIAFYYGANKGLKGLIGILILLASVGWLGAHILGGGMYLAWIVEIDLTYAKIVVTLGFAIYVIIGGYMAVVWTDTVQAIVLFLGFLLMAGIALVKMGGWEGLQEATGGQAFQFLEGPQFVPSLSLIFVIFVGVMATPAFRQRIYSSENAQTVRQSFYLTGGLYLLFSLIPALIGIAAFHLNPGLENSNFAFPYMATDVLPLSLGLVVLIAGLSATMSSASSDAIAAVSILLRDVYQLFVGHVPAREHAVSASRWGLLGIAGLALLFSLYSTDVIDYIKYMISLIMSGLFVCCMLGKYWKRATWQGGVAALLGGAVCSLVIMNIESWNTWWGNPSIPAVVCAAVAEIVVSYCTPVNTVSDEAALAILAKERSEMEIETAENT